MLNQLRQKKTQKRILIALAIIIIPAFVLWGGGSLSKKKVSGEEFLGVVGKHKVSIEEFVKARKGTEIQLIMNLMGQKELLEKVLGDRALVNKLTWDRLIMLNEAARLRINVSDKEVVDFITSQPLFMNKGVFDQKFYDMIISRSFGITTRAFEEQLRSSLRIMKLNERVLGGVTVTDEEALDAYKKQNQKAKVSYILVNSTDYEPQVTVSPEMIKEYYDANKREFNVPAKIGLEYMEFPFANLNEKDYVLLMAKGILAKIKSAPSSFADLAKENGRVIEETGPFSMKEPFTKFRFNLADYDRLFSLPEGASDVFADESLSGSVFIVRVTQKQSESIRPVNEVTTVIENKIKSEKAFELAKKKAYDIYAAIKNGSVTLDKAAADFNVKIMKTNLIGRFDYLDGVGPAPDMLDNVFGMKPGEVSEPYQTRRGYVIARVDEFQDVDMAGFDAAKDKEKEKVLSAKKNQAMGIWFNKISENAHLFVDLRQI